MVITKAMLFVLKDGDALMIAQMLQKCIQIQKCSNDYTILKSDL